MFVQFQEPGDVVRHCYLGVEDIGVLRDTDQVKVAVIGEVSDSVFGRHGTVGDFQGIVLGHRVRNSDFHLSGIVLVACGRRQVELDTGRVL